jgi:hypothetical protein
MGVGSDSLGRSSTPGNRVVRALVVALALALLSGLTVSASQAAARRAVSVSRSVSGGTALTGDAASVSGRVSVAPRGGRVALQRLVGRSWRTVRTDRLSAQRTYRFPLATRAAGTARYRVYSPADAGRRAGASRSFALNVLACPRSAAPARGVAAWFNHPGQRTPSRIVRGLSRLFCSAARGAHINIGLYFTTGALDRSEVGRLMVPLQRVARHRGVKVRFMLEGKLYGRGGPMASALPIIRRFATVSLCRYGCHNDRPGAVKGGGIQHHKFVTVSDTSWRRGVDPAVVVSTANWSHSQLHKFWQSALLLHNDRGLFREFDVQAKTLVACGTAAGCASWGTRMQQLSLSPRTYALTNTAGVWHDAAATERRGSTGTGRGVTFSPWKLTDPLAYALRGYRCTPEHRTVRVAHMFVTAGRQKVVNALRALRQSGCDVRVILRQLHNSPLEDGVRRIKAAGLPVRCLGRMHNKVILVDAVRKSDGRPDRVMWVGSQSLGANALRNNDESLLRLSTAEATGSGARLGNSRLWSAFLGDWGAMRRHQQPCG